MAGYVYCLSNECFEGIYKIGKSVDPFHRINELSNTSVPSEFKLEFCIRVNDYSRTELKIHKYFEDLGMRVNKSRKFFKCDLDVIYEYFKVVSKAEGARLYTRKRNNTADADVDNVANADTDNINDYTVEAMGKYEDDAVAAGDDESNDDKSDNDESDNDESDNDESEIESEDIDNIDVNEINIKVIIKNKPRRKARERTDAKICKKCARKFARPAALKQHLAKLPACVLAIPENPPDTMCGYCGYTFSSITNKRRHENICKVKKNQDKIHKMKEDDAAVHTEQLVIENKRLKKEMNTMKQKIERLNRIIEQLKMNCQKNNTFF